MPEPAPQQQPDQEAKGFTPEAWARILSEAGVMVELNREANASWQQQLDPERKRKDRSGR